jgi:hypothetical protein
MSTTASFAASLALFAACSPGARPAPAAPAEPARAQPDRKPGDVALPAPEVTMHLRVAGTPVAGEPAAVEVTLRNAGARVVLLAEARLAGSTGGPPRHAFRRSRAGRLTRDDTGTHYFDPLAQEETWPWFHAAVLWPGEEVTARLDGVVLTAPGPQPLGVEVAWEALPAGAAAAHLLTPSGGPPERIVTYRPAGDAGLRALRALPAGRRAVLIDLDRAAALLSRGTARGVTQVDVAARPDKP